jgi:hypothetical protein
MKRMGHLVVDSTRIRADASPEAVLKADEFEAVKEELERILDEAQVVDEREGREGRPAALRLGQPVRTEQMRDIVRRVRQAKRQAASSASQDEAEGSPTVETTAEKGGSRARRHGFGC